MKTRTKIMMALLCLVVIYISVFGYWWIGSKHESAVVNGKQMHGVRLHQSDLMSMTQPVWKPAFWFMESVCGYRYVGYVAEGEDSAFLFEK